MYKKLNKTLINDKKVNTYTLSKVLENDFSEILKNYVDGVVLNNINFELNDKGEYVLTYSVKFNRIKSFGYLQ